MSELPETSPGTDAPCIENLAAVLLPDQKRVRVSLLLNSAASSPTVQFRLLDHLQNVLMQSTIIGVFDESVNFTLHLTNSSADSQLFVTATIILNDVEVVDSKQVAVERGI